MDRETKKQLLKYTATRREGLSDSKSHEYGAGEDVLANFKRNSERLEEDIIKVWGLYFMKQVDSVETFIRKWAKTPGKIDRDNIVQEGEGIISRLDDIRNYADLLECILLEYGYHPYYELSTDEKVVRRSP